MAALTGGKDFSDYSDNWAMQRAVERGLEIISEASRHIPEDIKGLAPEIPWRQIAAIGNLLRHEYQRTDERATWNIVQEHLPALKLAIDRLLLAVGQD
ncbi:MAG: HepT-like ribonuclease domain-containing protein [Rhodospirillales bacterium]